MLAHEIEILKQMNHAHIIHLQEVYETPRVSITVLQVTNDAFDGHIYDQILQLNTHRLIVW